MSTFSEAIPVQIDSGAHLVTVATGVEGGGVEREGYTFDGFSASAGEIVHLPEEYPIVRGPFEKLKSQFLVEAATQTPVQILIQFCNFRVESFKLLEVGRGGGKIISLVRSRSTAKFDRLGVLSVCSSTAADSLFQSAQSLFRTGDLLLHTHHALGEVLLRHLHLLHTLSQLVVTLCLELSVMVCKLLEMCLDILSQTLFW